MREPIHTSLLLFLLRCFVLNANLQLALHEGPLHIETNSIPNNLDNPELFTSANSLSFDYWWFDFVSTTVVSVSKRL